jgi:hypothetical protein
VKLASLALSLAVAAALWASTTPAAATSSPPDTPSDMSGPRACDPACWQPALRLSWQWKLSEPPTAKEIAANDYDPWDIDGFEARTSTVAALKPRSHVACYISAGSYEAWRPDAPDFPGAGRIDRRTPKHVTHGVIGWKMAGWDERWLDIRHIRRAGNQVAEIMTARIAMCGSKGFDAVEFDNVEGYSNNTGFPLTGKHQLRFNTWLANTAHAHGLAAILKNDVPQITRLLPYFDVALNEQCWQYAECTTRQTGRSGYDQFVAAGKPVLGVEYSGKTDDFCPRANAANFNWLKKKLSLGSYRVACR